MLEGHTNLKHATTKETSPPTLCECLISNDLTSVRVKALSGSNSVLLNVESQSDKWRNRISQVHKRGRRYYAHEAKVIRDGGCDDKRYAPPDWYDDGVKKLAAFGDQGRCILVHKDKTSAGLEYADGFTNRYTHEGIHENVVVEHLDTDVSIKPSGD